MTIRYYRSSIQTSHSCPNSAPNAVRKGGAGAGLNKNQPPRQCLQPTVRTTKIIPTTNHLRITVVPDGWFPAISFKSSIILSSYPSCGWFRCKLSYCWWWYHYGIPGTFKSLWSLDVLLYVYYMHDPTKSQSLGIFSCHVGVPSMGVPLAIMNLDWHFPQQKPGFNGATPSSYPF